MSADYKNMRLKKIAELEAAISNVPKNLYEWKGGAEALSTKAKTASLSSMIRPTNFSELPARVKPLRSTLKTLKRTNSLKEGGDNEETIRLFTSAVVRNRCTDENLRIVEDLSDMSSDELSNNQRIKSEPIYFNKFRQKSGGQASFRNVSDKEAELVN